MDEDSIHESVSKILSAIDINQIKSLRRDHNGHPLMLEVERIISWLELFSTLLKALIRMNSLLEKNHSFHVKMAKTLKESREKKAQLLSITSNGHSSEGSESSPRTSSHSSAEEVLDPAVVDSLADKVASLLQVTSSRKAPSKNYRSKTSNPVRISDHRIEEVRGPHIPTVNTQPKTIDTSSVPRRSNLSNNTQPKTLDASTFTRRSNLPSKIDKVRAPEKSTSTKITGNEHHHSHRNNPSKLSSWFVEFPDATKNQGKLRVRVMKESPQKLQQIFEMKCRHLKERSAKRAELISTKAMVRKLTSEERLRNAVAECVRENREREARRDQGLKWSQSAPYDYLVRDGIKMKRIFTHKQMRDQTERMYTKLPEVVQREKELKREESKRVHRVMKQVFNHQMKRNISHGRLNFPITQNFTIY